ncbi:hypothetical protein Clacol_000355 [Clathrus columnatus]|uniref:Cytochrome P450 n=1 Tax=Clathrus columnatus TaxID=1419009 RepID=A0AAV4ZWF1_9AGAM|nr:hypothetical protein Clacol_000355 [Clathrus columnatus]
MNQMSSENWGFLTDLEVIFVAIGFFYLTRAYLWNLRTPPGPKRIPIIGNLLDMPKEKECLKFTEWAHKYGNIVYLKIFRQHYFILSNYEDVFELLHKRSRHYSDRPVFPMSGELMGWDVAISLRNYDDSLRSMRRLAHQTFNPELWPLEENEIAKLPKLLLKTPADFEAHIRRTVSSVVLKATYGYSIPDGEEGNDDLMVKLPERGLHEFSIAQAPGAFLVDLIPLLKYVPPWFPGAGFRRKAMEWKLHLQEMMDTPFEFTKSQMNSGDAPPSLVSIHYPKAKSPEEIAILKHTAGSICYSSGGTDTTSAAIITFFAAMTLYPEVQRKAQEELDSLIGLERLPCVADRPSLPYVEAVLKEVLRWVPVVPIGVPHRASQHDIYKGYDIPKGSIIFSNIWAMTRDKKYFPDPDVFRPGRFLSGELPESRVVDPLQTVFGFGRRSCPGQRVAEPSLFLAITMVLLTFNITKAKDPNTGEDITPVIETTPGLVM